MERKNKNLLALLLDNILNTLYTYVHILLGPFCTELRLQVSYEFINCCCISSDIKFENFFVCNIPTKTIESIKQAYRKMVISLSSICKTYCLPLIILHCQAFVICHCIYAIILVMILNPLV